VHGWSPERLAEAAGARVVRGADGSPSRATIDSRAAGEGDLFVGLRGANVDGSRFADQALAQGAWGVLVSPGSCEQVPGGAILEAEDTLAALQRLATAWRRELQADVIGITGSTGKTSTKDVTAAMVAQGRPVVATRENLNTEIGLPLTILEAPPGTEVLVLEMAMRGPGQIAELGRIAEPDVAVITNIGPVHLQQLGSLEAIAAEKGSIMGALPPGGTAVVPADEPLLDPHVPAGVRTVTFGAGGDVAELPDGLHLPFASAYMRHNALAALAAARAVGVEPTGELTVTMSRLRGERRQLADGTVVVDDCYNANPMSMRAALDDLAATAPGRAVAVLGDMLELGPQELRFHRELGEHAARAGVAELVTAGPLAAEAAQAFHDATGRPAHAEEDAAAAAERAAAVVRAGDTVLVKASRGVGLEVVAERLARG
jgi:UDP-N-acetylmuramoyl-tripeptide--D-alanyl-D-alanine ligase